MSGDMSACLYPWFESIKAEGGLSALSHQVGDYSLFYQTLISLMTYIPISCVFQYKILSGVFDAAVAVALAVIYRDLCLGEATQTGTLAPMAKSDRQSIITKSCVLGIAVWMLPTVILNSAYWGQCDSIFSFFCLMTLYLLRRDSWIGAFVFLGLAFACKLQTVFVLPIISVYYLVSKRFSAIYLLITVAVLWLSGILAFAYGRDLLAPVSIYLEQSREYPEMYVNFTSFWTIVGNDYGVMKWFAILFTLFVLSVGAYYCLRRKELFRSGVSFYAAAAWFMWSMLLFLPCMHDRYAYLLDLRLVLLAFLDRRFVPCAVVSVLTSLFLYAGYLFVPKGAGVDFTSLRVATVIYLLTYLYFTAVLCLGGLKRLTCTSQTLSETCKTIEGEND